MHIALRQETGLFLVELLLPDIASAAFLVPYHHTANTASSLDTHLDVLICRCPPIDSL